MRLFAVALAFLLTTAATAAEKLDDGALLQLGAAVFDRLMEAGFSPSGTSPTGRYHDELSALDEAIDRAQAPTSAAAAKLWQLRGMVLMGEGRAEELAKQADAAATLKLPDDLVATLRGMAVGAAIQPGKPFPDFTLTDLAGAEHRLADYRGKVVLLDFWATWCGPCLREMPHVAAAWQSFHARGFEVLGVSMDEDRARLDDYLRDHGTAWPQSCDLKGMAGDFPRRLGIQSIPSPFLIGPDGTLIAKDIRGDDLKQAIEKALPAK